MAEGKPWWREFVETILWALVIALILRTFIVQAFWIPSGSMVPTLEPGDRVLVAKFWYSFRKPERGDIFVFKFPLDPKRDFVKRIIGLPGDFLDVRDGIVYINEKPLHEKYVKWRDDFSLFPNILFPQVPIRIPEGRYFAMGDNRSHSQDSRYWGFVPEEYIRGPVFFRYWPFRRIGVVH
ncbi:MULTISPECIES: signal peptidase I [Aminobacterium]|jgi:signal peptidase I|uniref:Signal peptidase I n=1 Tax=Aminobacterium colombiense (strain DSM 12261 / ALA-1) TaxID=572547 RepID=D5EGG3_AMICL|nr:MULTISPECIES: signal peptidase I [Aminobacterium]MDD2378511.1 signal peptidase I [Aminobacterium colombiense]ADE57645.1 signal peptidase I [Aminobacterium colombiense DSM 12261]MDD3768671.1 signal peptidase I [Aminobacterium colombiense]MDD4265056.1 signal peptidase I [Aminobacterium colombiense]MDD4586229.1 signal peptidase I [Aminobacterium colombiense]